MSGLYQVYERGQTHFQIGDNTNLFDWTYVTNVARAHLLAADKLVPPPPPSSTKEHTENGCHPKSGTYYLTEVEEDMIGYQLPFVSLTTGNQRVPTCEARPLGPFVTLPPNGERIAAAFAAPPEPYFRPLVRSRFDPLSEDSIIRSKIANNGLSPLGVAGQAFFITNGEPCYFWDFPRLVWKHLDAVFPGMRDPQRKFFVMSKPVGLAAATAAEWAGWIVGKEPAFTRFKVSYSCATRWHNIEKARRVLGYEPEVGLEEGIKRMVEVCDSFLVIDSESSTRPPLQWWKTQYESGDHKQKH